MKTTEQKDSKVKERKDSKQGKVVNMQGEEVNDIPVVAEQIAPEQPRFLKLSENDANSFLQIMGIILVNDDRLKPLESHFIQIIKRNNEIPK